MKPVDPRLCLVCGIIEEFSEINFEGEFMSIVDLVESDERQLVNKWSESYLDHGIALNIILKTLQLEM